MFVEMVMTHAGTQSGDGEVPEKEELRARLERHEARTKRVEEAILEVEARARKIEYSLLAVFPSKFPDLSSESPLIVSGRYRGTFPDTLKVNGILADMSNFHIDLKVEKAKEIPVGKIVANHQIELLTAEAWYSENVELKEKVAKMSVQHAIVSESYMVLLEIQQGKLSADSTVAPQAPGRFSVDRQVSAKVDYPKKEVPKPPMILTLCNIGLGFGNLSATVNNIPPGSADKHTGAAEVFVRAASNCCGWLCNHCCCMCCIQTCSKVVTPAVVEMMDDENECEIYVTESNHHDMLESGKVFCNLYICS
ncbi:hypothetical protein OROGR_017895 [Orobanche gracilis]